MPERSEVGDGMRKALMQEIFRESKIVKPFVEVRVVFDDNSQHVQRTEIAEGAFPEWN